MHTSKTYKMSLCALFAALTAIGSQIAVAIGPVPVNLATFVVFCAGAILGPRLGALSMGIWVLLGAVGVPVFSLMRGGLQMLVGPTGGYIIGYVPAAFVTGLIMNGAKSGRIAVYPLAMFAGMVIYFTIGTAWYMILTRVGFAEACMTCVVPFIPFDLLKIAAATAVSHRLRSVSPVHARV